MDLKELVDQLNHRGIQLPILLRFSDILHERIGVEHQARRRGELAGEGRERARLEREQRAAVLGQAARAEEARGPDATPPE